MRWRRPRGNILLTAIFVSVFLFFLSVALVATNRQDLRLALTTDARYRSRMAARAATEYGLQVMRERADWPALIGNGSIAEGSLSGSEWSVTVAPFQDVDRCGYYWDVRGTGRASGVVESAHLIVEEAALVKDLPAGKGAWLFASSTVGDLLALDGSLKWRKLGVMPSLDAWLQARNGPLFTYGPTGALLTLAQNGEVLEWLDIPDPGVELLPTKPVGPVNEYYQLTGTALGADGDRAWCHATHVLEQKTQQGDQRFEAPAVLSYDLSDQQWTVVSDMMTVTDPLSPPVIRGGPRPDVDTMGIVQGRVYALQLDAGQQVVVANDDGWTLDTRIQGVSKGLFEIGGRLAAHEAGEVQPAGLLDFGVGGLFPQTELGRTVPPLLGVKEDGTDVRVRPELRWDATVSSTFTKAPYGADSVAMVGSTVITPLLVRRVAMEPAGLPCLPPFSDPSAFDPRTALVLGVYDGTHWQVLPGGMERCVAKEVQAGTASSIRVKAVDGNEYTVRPDLLAAALYPDPDPPMRRYAVVERY